jgi:hypothetical protein
VETLWLNFFHAPTALLDYQYLVRVFRERERINRADEKEEGQIITAYPAFSAKLCSSHFTKWTINTTLQGFQF